MLKKLLFFTLFPTLLVAQIYNPITWSTEAKALGDDIYEIHLTGKITPGWHVYSQSHPEDGVGIPASVEFEANPKVELIGKAKEIGNKKEAYSQLFEQDEIFYENEIAFVQKLRLKDSETVQIKFNVETQACDDEKCLPPDWSEFSVKITPQKKLTNNLDNNNADDEKDSQAHLNSTENNPTNEKTDSAQVLSKVQIKNIKNVNTAPEIKSEPKKSLWKTFLEGALGGLLALIMPCVYPLIPLTVSMFTKQSASKKKGILNAGIFGLSIIGIFVISALVITRLFGPAAMNELSTNPVMNIVFFLIFIFFAISFFGAFELTLPSKWINYSDKKADKGGLIGIFFMAFTLVLVSFSCTLPIIGTLATAAFNKGEYYSLLVGSLGFSVTLALPFVFFALFPSLLGSLPKSGGWMNTIKVCLGFIELALAMKFLSNADLVLQLHLLEREVFLAFWIAIFGLMGIYLIGGIKLPLDSSNNRIGIGRLFFAVITFSFVIYMIPGLWGAPLKIISGLTPPIHYAESPSGFANNQNSNNSFVLENGMKLGPHDIPAFRDMEDAINYSKKVQKPILIDFTGHACANCRKVEERVWIDSRIKQILTEEVVLVSLYVDERNPLAQEEQIFSEDLGKELKTVGNKWTAFQMKEFKTNAQPYYIIVDENLTRYTEPLGAEMNIDVYLNWLKEGIEKYNNSKLNQ